MKSRKWSWMFAAVLASVMIAGCGGGGGGSGGSAENGTVDGDDTASGADVTTENYDVTLPEGVTTGDVDGDFDGKMVFAGEDDAATSVVFGGAVVPRGFTGVVTAADPSPRDVTGFVAERPAPLDASDTPAASASATIDLAVAAVEAELNVTSDRTGITATGFQEISRQSIASGVIELGTFRLTTSGNAKPTDVASELVELWGLNDEEGSVNNFPNPLGDEIEDTTFTIRAGVLYDSSDRIFVAVAVVPTDLAGTYKGLTDLLADPNNAVVRGTNVLDQTDEFTGTGGGGVADFLFVVDNSASMSNEQINLANAASAFSGVLDGSGLDFQLGVVTTDSSDLKGGGFTGDTATFESVVNGLGTSGSGTESGIFHGEAALESGGSVDNAGFPRQGAQMSVVMISDERDQYTAFQYSDGVEFDMNSNVFLDNGHIVHAIVDTDPTTRFGTDNFDYGENYIELANNTGGSRAPITTPDGRDLEKSDFTQIMTAIAQKAGGAASQFRLSETPIPSTIAVTNEGTSVPRDSADGWVYNSSANAVVFNGNEVPDGGDTVKVSYRYAEGGTSGGGSTGADFEGTWSGTATSSETSSTANVSCDGDVDSGTITITNTSGDDYEIDEINGTTFNGTASGDQLSSSSVFSYPEDGGTTTVSNWSVTLDSSGDAFSGSADFAWTDGVDACTGTSSISANRQ